jgi:multidrug efflux pump subunit AcrA (membrane-fusion protein)
MKKKLIQYCLIGVTILTGCNRPEKIQPQRKNIVDAVFASGSIITEDQYSVTSQSEGYLVNSFVKEADTVKIGQTLFHIYDDAQKAQLESATANYQNALDNVGSNSAIIQQLNAQLTQLKNKFVNDSLNFIRYSNLVKTNAVSKSDYEKAKLAFNNSKQELQSIEIRIQDTKKNLELELIKSKANLAAQQNASSYYYLNSRVQGTVLQIFKTNGDLVRRGETVAEIGAGNFVIKLFISEDDINSIKVGQDVYVELNTEKNKSYQAGISKIYPAFDPKEQSFIAEARFVEPVANLKSGTQLQANIVIQRKELALVIPSNYLLPDDYVITSNKKEKVKVRVGIKTTEWAEIISGLDGTTTIIRPN